MPVLLLDNQPLPHFSPTADAIQVDVVNEFMEYSGSGNPK
jgi:hypothetical protein